MKHKSNPPLYSDAYICSILDKLIEGSQALKVSCARGNLTERQKQSLAHTIPTAMELIRIAMKHS